MSMYGGEKRFGDCPEEISYIAEVFGKSYLERVYDKCYSSEFKSFLSCLKRAGIETLEKSIEILGKESNMHAFNDNMIDFGWYLVRLRNAGLEKLESSVEFLGKEANMFALESTTYRFGEYLENFERYEPVLRRLTKDLGRKVKNPSKDLIYYFTYSFDIFSNYVGKGVEFDVFEINGKDYILPYYRLELVEGSKAVRGKRGVKALLRGENGSIKAIPKINIVGVENMEINRTCFIPGSALEVKGIGTVDGKPAGEYKEVSRKDPVGGFLLENGWCEYHINLLLYIAGVDVPEPVALVELDEPVDGKKIAVFYKKVKTPFRGGDTPYDEIKKVEFIGFKGFLSTFRFRDNHNRAGQILDFERLDFAEDVGKDIIKPTAYREKKFLRVAAEALRRGKRVDLEKRIISMRRDEKENIFRNLEELYSLASKNGLRVVPKEFSDWTADMVFKAKRGGGEVEAPPRFKKCLMDPRVLVGEYAIELWEKGERNGRIKRLKERYERDVGETRKVIGKLLKDKIEGNFLVG